MKRFFLFLMVTLLVLSNIMVPVDVFASTSITPVNNLKEDEYVIVDGEKIFLEREIKDGFSKVIVKNEKGEILSESSLNLKTNEAVVDGVKLSDEEFQEVVDISEDIKSDSELSKSNLINSDEYTTMAACNYKKIGKTKKKNTWIPKTSVAAAAGVLALIPGVGWASAWTIASIAIASTDRVYYTVTEYSCKSGGYYHLKTTRKFYKKSNYTGHIKTISVYGKRR